MIENCLIWNCQVYSIWTIDRVLPGSCIIMHCGIRWMCLVRKKAYEADGLQVSYAHGRSIFTINVVAIKLRQTFSVSNYPPLSSLLVGLCIYLVLERTRGEKHLQYVSGVGPVRYWLITYLWDMLMFLVPIGLTLLLMYLFNVQAYVAGDNLLAVFLLFFCYSWVTVMEYRPVFFTSMYRSQHDKQLVSEFWKDWRDYGLYNHDSCSWSWVFNSVQLPCLYRALNH